MADAAARVVSIVAVHQNVCVGFEVGAHPADNVALAVERLPTDDDSRCPCCCRSIVVRVVVVQVNNRARHRFAEGGDDLGNGDLLTVTGDQNGHLDFWIPCACSSNAAASLRKGETTERTGREQSEVAM
jgi:hypothetical protein